MRALRIIAPSLVSAFSLLTLQGCNYTKSFTFDTANPIELESDPPPNATHGSTATPVTVDTSGVSSTVRKHISKADVQNLTVTIDKVFGVGDAAPANAATQLTQARFTITDDVDTAVTGTYTVGLIPIVLSSVHTLTDITPVGASPSIDSLLHDLVKSGHQFKVSADSDVDAAPVHIEVQLSISVKVTVKAF
jgi:hypothetical protein